jgi:2-aminobenzoate-CoA ligase
MVASASRSAHVDTFVRDHLPPRQDWPVLDYSGLPEYPAQLNCAAELLDRHVVEGHGARPAIHFEDRVFSYAEVHSWANRIAAFLTNELRVRPGARVLLRGFNSPWMVAAWLAIVKAGAVVVATMPQLRARELAHIVQKAAVDVALCDHRLAEEMRAARERTSHSLRVALVDEAFESAMSRHSDRFANAPTMADDPVLIAFTSGTTGQPKGAVHVHRDVLAICDTFSQRVLDPHSEDVFVGSPPLAFTYGLGALVTFPMRVGASTVLLEKCTPDVLLQSIQTYRITTLFTAPTMYRALLEHVRRFDLESLRTCVSAGEQLPLPTFQAWQSATGLRIVDGIGATELLHIFISAAGEDIRPGATGKVVPGYRAQVVDDQGIPVPPGVVGKLAVQGPTGCRYLADPDRQRLYVRGGWNMTGDAYMMDADGYFWYQARADDMIISAGYNIAGPEVENVLLEHPKVRECAVVGVPDEQRGHAVKAFVVLRDPVQSTLETVRELQDFVKSEIAPYKYPRQVEFVDALPRTETGKLQRYKLREP